jgi:putative endonuclease
LSKCYCGSTDNFAKRLNEHNAGKGNFTSKGIPWEKVKIIELASRSEAMKLESQIKKRGIKRYLDDLEVKTSGGGAAR